MDYFVGFELLTRYRSDKIGLGDKTYQRLTRNKQGPTRDSQGQMKMSYLSSPSPNMNYIREVYNSL